MLGGPRPLAQLAAIGKLLGAWVSSAAMSDQGNIARQATTGSIYTIVASAITLVFGVVRTTLMLRLLPPEDFGTTALATFYATFAIIVSNFGLDSAFIHHRQADETVRRTYFTLRVVTALAALLLVGLLTPLIARFHVDVPQLTAVLLVYLLIFGLRELNRPQLSVLEKNLGFRQIAQMDVICSLVMSIVAPTLAWLGWGVWAIAAELLSGTAVRSFILNVIYRPWRPRFGWNADHGRWFWQYGKKAWHSSNIAYLLDRFDDWYTGTFLGHTALGYYSRAYEYATYSQRIIANPVMSVFHATFARVQADRPTLSRAFYRSSSLMIYSGGLFSLLFILTAPEFIPLFLGQQWRPMQTTFQLMIVYVLLEPLSMSARNLLMAIGQPQQVLRARLVQTAVFLPALFGLGQLFGINGVAIAADLMALAGTAVLFYYARQHTDFSVRRIWFWPISSILVTAVLVLALNPFWQQLDLWLSLGLKLLLITAVYGTILLLTEKEQLRSGWQIIWGIIRPTVKQPQSTNKL